MSPEGRAVRLEREGELAIVTLDSPPLNLFDQLGHALGITLVEFPGNPATQCGYPTGPSVPARGGGTTTDPRNFAECAGILGDKQPGINFGTHPSGLFGNLSRYDPSVCPDGSQSPSICNPADAPHASASIRAATTAPAPPQQQQQQTPKVNPKDLNKVLPPGVNPNKLPNKVQQQLQDLLPQLPQLPQVPQLPQGINLNGSAPAGSTNNLLNFLLGQ